MGFSLRDSSLGPTAKHAQAGDVRKSDSPVCQTVKQGCLFGAGWHGGYPHQSRARRAATCLFNSYNQILHIH